MLSTLTKHEIIQYIPGPVGKLQMAVAEIEPKAHKPWGIVCHPHPLFGGTMHNKVVTTLVKAFQAVGLNTVRFNFRGVEGSAGLYDHANGELQDLLTVIDWVKEEKLNQEIWLAGFSFGAFIAAKAATLIDLKTLVTVAPPVTNFPMQELPAITCPWILAQGENDEVVDAKLVFAWAKDRQPKPVILRFPEASHFFHGQLGELRVRLEGVLRG